MYFLMYHVIDVVNKMSIQNISSKQRRLQARAYPGIARVILKCAYSYHNDQTRKHVACSQTNISVLMHVQMHTV